MGTRYTAVTAHNGSLSEEELRGAVPSIFALAQHESRSPRYTYIPTIDIVKSLANEGFRPTWAMQATPRDAAKTGYTKHMLRFRQADTQLANGEVPEVVLINSHDGSTKYQMLAGIFRFICGNGMIVGDTFDKCSVRHSGNIKDNVVEAAHQIASTFEFVMNATAEMKRIELAPAEQLILAEGAAELRFDLEANEESPVRPQLFLEARRDADAKNDLWTVFNRVQENTLRGGLAGYTPETEASTGRRVRTREVKGIDQSVKLNRCLWSLAEKMAALKNGKEIVIPAPVAAEVN